MKIGFISDLHVNYWGSDFPINIAKEIKDKDIEVLIIAGDISNDPATTMEYLASHYTDIPILFIDGNHEHYNTTMSVKDNCNVLKNQQPYSNRSYLGTTGEYYFRPHFLGDGWAVVGTNGWYDFNFTKDPIEKLICRAGIADTSNVLFHNEPEELAKEAVTNLLMDLNQLTLDDSTTNIIIVTHTVPHIKGLSNNAEHKRINGAWFNSQMQRVVECDYAKKIKLWNFGHTHYSFDFVDNGIRYVANPLGYKHDPTNYAKINGIKVIDTRYF